MTVCWLIKELRSYNNTASLVKLVLDFILPSHIIHLKKCPGTAILHLISDGNYQGYTVNLPIAPLHKKIEPRRKFSVFFEKLAVFGSKFHILSKKKKYLHLSDYKNWISVRYRCIKYSRKEFRAFVSLSWKISTLKSTFLTALPPPPSKKSSFGTSTLLINPKMLTDIKPQQHPYPWK